MVGQGVLRECLLDPNVERVLSIVRAPTDWQNAKLIQLVHNDFLDLSTIEPQLTGYDVCFFCVGITSSGLSEQAYTRVTYDMTMAAAQTLLRLNPNMSFLFISGAGSDSTEKGRIMWARVKGRTENALLRLPFKAAYLFRPAIIQPLHGIQSKTSSYRVLYTLTKPLLPVLRWLFPNQVTTTEALGRAMIHVALHDYSKPVLEMRDIHQASLAHRTTL